MATEDIWPAVQALAATWSGSPLVEAFLSRHPARTDSEDAVTEALRNLQAGTNALTEAPLVTMAWEQLAQLGSTAHRRGTQLPTPGRAARSSGWIDGGLGS